MWFLDILYLSVTLFLELPNPLFPIFLLSEAIWGLTFWLPLDDEMHRGRSLILTFRSQEGFLQAKAIWFLFWVKLHAGDTVYTLHWKNVWSSIFALHRTLLGHLFMIYTFYLCFSHFLSRYRYRLYSNIMFIYLLFVSQIYFLMIATHYYIVIYIDRGISFLCLKLILSPLLAKFASFF